VMRFGTAANGLCLVDGENQLARKPVRGRSVVEEAGVSAKAFPAERENHGTINSDLAFGRKIIAEVPQ
jgi:hypothetical protein